jgi:hypothetical protein
MADTQLNEVQAQEAEKLLGKLDGTSLDNVFTAQEVASVIKMVLEAKEKDEITNTFLRADFADDLQALAAARHIAKCREFNDILGELHTRLIIHARSAIGAKRVETAVRAASPQYQPPKHNSWQDKIKQKAGVE